MFKVNIPIISSDSIPRSVNEIRKTIKFNILKLFEKYNYNNLEYLIDKDLESINDFVFDISAEDITGEGIHIDTIKTIFYRAYYNSIISGKYIKILEDIIKIIYLTKLKINLDLFKQIYGSDDCIFINSYTEDTTLFIINKLKFSNEEYKNIYNYLREYILSKYNINLNDSIALMFCKVLNDIILREIESFTRYDLKEIREDSINRISYIK